MAGTGDGRRTRPARGRAGGSAQRAAAARPCRPWGGRRSSRLCQIPGRLLVRAFVSSVVDRRVHQGGFGGNTLRLTAADGTIELVEGGGGRPCLAGLHHLGISVTSLERSLRLYCEAVGADLLVGPNDGTSPSFRFGLSGELRHTVEVALRQVCGWPGIRPAPIRARPGPPLEPDEFQPPPNPEFDQMRSTASNAAARLQQPRHPAFAKQHPAEAAGPRKFPHE